MFKKCLYLLPLIPFVLLFLVISVRFLLVDPPVFPDETYFVDIAQQKNYYGVQRLSLYEIPASGQSVRAYSYPPLYTDILSIWIGTAGKSIESIRILSLFMGLCTICVWYMYSYVKTSSIATSLLLTITLLFYGPFGMASRIARMEQFILFALVVGLYMLTVAPTKKVTYLCAGVVAASALLFHSAGILVIGILLLTILFLSPSQHKKRQLGLFFIPIVFGVCWWLWRYIDRIDLVFLQTSMQFGYKATREALLTLLFKNDVLWRLRILLYITLCSTVCILGILRKNKTLLVTSLIAFLSLLGVIYGKEQWYLLYIIIPFLLLFIALYEEHIYKRITSIFLVVLLLLNTASTIPFILNEQKHNSSYGEFVSSISQRIPKNSKILVSALPDPTFDLWEQGYTHVYAVPHVSDPGMLFTHLQQYDYLVINVITNPELKEILNTSEYKSETIKSGGYVTEIIKLQ